MGKIKEKLIEEMNKNPEKYICEREKEEMKNGEENKD